MSDQGINSSRRLFTYPIKKNTLWSCFSPRRKSYVNKQHPTYTIRLRCWFLHQF